MKIKVDLEVNETEASVNAKASSILMLGDGTTANSNPLRR